MPRLTITAMQTFADPCQAKDFLISCVVAQAQRDGVPLSELERRMLAYSEVDCAPPDFADLSEAFDREYEMPVYEAKVAGIIRSFYKRARLESPTELSDWDVAYKLLRKQDHYLLVLIGAAKGNLQSIWLSAKVGRFGRLILIGLAMGVVISLVIFLLIHLR